MNQGKSQIILVWISLAALLLVPIVTSNQIVYAETSPKILVADHLKNNPLAIKIITEMEAQKLRYNQQQTQKLQETTKVDPLQEELEQKRIIAKHRLEQRIQDLAEKTKEYTPKAAFTKFLEKKPEYTHTVFWGMFDYMQGKVDTARAAMKKVLDNGGSLKEARDAYFANAASTRVQLIQVVKDLNVQHGLADKSVQDTFDEFGKLPRYD